MKILFALNYYLPERIAGIELYNHRLAVNWQVIRFPPVANIIKDKLNQMRKIMNKSFINNITRRLGFEVHGNGYIQSLKKTFFKEDPLLIQKEILGNSANVIFDVGANVGNISLQYHQLFPKAAIYAFEPFPQTFSILEESIKNYKTILGIQLAIADEEGTKKFYANQNPDTNSLLKPTKIGLNSDAQVANKEIISVNVTTIDSYCVTNNIDAIDILKLDIQGGELAALKGAVSLLEQGKIKLIYSESYFRQQYVGQPLFADLCNYLRQYNYFPQDIYNPIYGKGAIAWCDVIFLLSK